MPNSTKTSDEYDSRNDEIVYDGSPLWFFDYDRQVTRYAKKMLGATGIKIWNASLPTPTNANRASIANEWVADVQDTKGYREANEMDEDNSWKTATKLKKQRLQSFLISKVMRLKEPPLAMLRISSKHFE